MKKFAVGAFLVKNYFVALSAVLVVVAGVTYWYIAKSGAPSFAAVRVERGNVVASVDQQGNIIAENNVNLSFQESGQIAAVYVYEGESVGRGTVLAALDQSSLKAALAQARAAVASAQARLDGLTSGTRPEALQISKAALASAQTSLVTALESAYAAADDAVKNQVDNMFSNPEYAPVFLVPDSDAAAVANIQDKRQAVGAALKSWYAAESMADSDPSSLAKTADGALGQIYDYLNLVAPAVDQAIASVALPSATLAQYKTNISTARSEVTASANALASAEAAFTNAENKLALDEAGATPQEIEAQKAAVAGAEAAAASAEVALNHAVLTAPFAGIVQNLTAKTGQVVTPGTPMLSLVNNGGLKIEIYVSENDIAKIKEGETANVTVDAYGTGAVFPAIVTAVGVTKTAVNGAPAYKVTLHFVNPDERLKDGMSASVHVIAEEHDNVVEIPSRLVITENSRHFVLAKNGGATERREIQVGITGSDGMTEVISGLSPGDFVLAF